jgi:hypothetical protein
MSKMQSMSMFVRFSISLLTDMQYYPLQRNWRKAKPHLNHPTVQATLVEDFNKFTFGRWNKPFVAGMVPHEFESCDWHLGLFGMERLEWGPKLANPNWCRG